METTMGPVVFERPQAGEFAPFYAGYVARVPDGDLLAFLEAQLAEGTAFLRGLEGIAEHRYAEGKWSVKEVVGHVADTERIMAYRALRVARGDATPLPGFEENSYVAAAGFGARTLVSLVEEWADARRASISLLRGLDAKAVGRRGVVNDNGVTARALAWIIAGHTAHHLEILRTRYAAA